MKVLVTGGGGFVARYAAAELAEHGHAVTLTSETIRTVRLDKWSWRTLPCDLTRPTSVNRLIQRVRPNAVLHLAGLSHSQETNTASVFDANAGTTLELCRALVRRNASVTFLMASTALVFSPSVARARLNEATPVGPWTPYGWSKLAAEAVVHAHDGKTFLGYVARSFNHIGPGQSRRFVCSALAHRIAEAKEGSWIEVGNLAVERDFSDVRDIVRAYRLILEKRPLEKTFVLGSGRSIRISDIAARFLTLSGKRLAFRRSKALARRVDPSAMIANATLARRRLGWRCRVPLQQTLREMYYNAQLNSR